MFNPTQSYLIACNPRTGSWMLTYALQDSGVAASPDEYFAPEIEEFWTLRFALEPPGVGGSYRDYLTAVFRFGTSSDGFFGTKLLWQSVGAFTGRLREIPLYADLETADLLPTDFRVSESSCYSDVTRYVLRSPDGERPHLASGPSRVERRASLALTN